MSVLVSGNDVYLHLELSDGSITAQSVENRSNFFVRAGRNIKYFVCITNADICIIECTGEYFQKEYCYYSKFVNQTVAECGLVKEGMYYKFKEFEQSMMTEYKYKYRNGILEDRKVIYKGEYVSDPIKHYPRKEGTSTSNPSEIISGETKPTSRPADIASGAMIAVRKTDSTMQRQSQEFSGSELSSENNNMSYDSLSGASRKQIVVTSYNDYCHIPDDVTELEFKQDFYSWLMKDILIGNYAYNSLTSLVFGDNVQKTVNGTKLEISSCPSLKTIVFGKEAFNNYMAFLFIGMICSLLPNRLTSTRFDIDGTQCFGRGIQQFFRDEK